jgi:hypothetical protein
MRTLARMVRPNIQPDCIPVKASGGRHIFHPQSDNSNVKVHLFSF